MIKEESLTVCIDFKNPEAYLAWAPTCAFAKAQNIEIDWQPFVGPHPKVPERVQPNHKTNRGTTHRRMRFEYRQQNTIRYSSNPGLTQAELNRKIDSEPAALGLLWCQRVSQRCTELFIGIVFAACWQQKVDIADLQVILNAIEEAGAGIEHFDSFLNDAGPHKLAEIRDELKEHGVFDTPFYLLQGESFLGRQHLPMIQWLLSKKQGVKPI